MAGSTPAFADVPAKTWRLLASSVLDFIIIALVVTTVALWGLAGDLPRTLVMSLSALVTIVLTVMWWR